MGNSGCSGGNAYEVRAGGKAEVKTDNNDRVHILTDNRNDATRVESALIKAGLHNEDARKPFKRGDKIV